jgi:hypothetical protein
MEKYKRSLKLQNGLYLFGAALLIAVQVLAFCQIIQPVAADSHWAARWNGFIAGASFSVMCIFMLGLFFNLRALLSETALKKLHAKAFDERSEQIALHAQACGARIFLIVMLPVLIVCGYFSVAVSVSCLCCVLLLSVIIAVAKLYWHHRL